MEIFLEIGLILGITVLISGIIKLLKQPLIIGYILTGIIVGPYFLNIVRSVETIEIFSQIGIAFLLFVVGLSLSPKVIKEVGKVSLITGLGQIIFTSLIGFLISTLLGFSMIASLYISIALTFSSTIIILKLLSDKRDLEKLYGKISIGFLLVQDLFVIVLLMFLSSFSGGFQPGYSWLLNIFFGILVVAAFVIISVYALPRFSGFFAKSQEFLFLFSIGWGLGLASVFYYLGLSIEVGALIAGISLSISPLNYEISSKMRPLRDFFIIMFFILLGSQMTFGNFNELVFPAIVFSLFILIGNPLIVIVLMGALGYRKKVGFQAGFTVAQISEFSLILVTMGIALGHIGGEILSMVTLVGLVTISGSTYLVLYSDRLYTRFSGLLSIFERKNAKKEKSVGKDYEIILFGKNRIGYILAESFKKIGKKFLVIDYNPETVSELAKKGINCRYGDASDEEFLECLNLAGTKMIVSTIPDFETNMLLIEKTRRQNQKAIILVISHNIDEAKRLYGCGATYVIMPHFLGGDYASMMIEKYRFDAEGFLKEKQRHLKELDFKKERGHEHPKIEKNR